MPSATAVPTSCGAGETHDAMSVDPVTHAAWMAQAQAVRALPCGAHHARARARAAEQALARVPETLSASAGRLPAPPRRQPRQRSKPTPTYLSV